MARKRATSLIFSLPCLPLWQTLHTLMGIFVSSQFLSITTTGLDHVSITLHLPQIFLSNLQHSFPTHFEPEDGSSMFLWITSGQQYYTTSYLQRPQAEILQQVNQFKLLYDTVSNSHLYLVLSSMTDGHALQLPAMPFHLLFPPFSATKCLNSPKSIVLYCWISWKLM